MRTTPRAIGPILIGALVYLGIVIAAGGGFTAFFAHPARTAVVAIVILLAAATLFSAGNMSPGEHEDRQNRWVLGALGVIGVLNAFLPAYMDRQDMGTFGGDAVRWSGVVLFALGGILRLWPVFALGQRFSGLVAIQKGHRLVTNGIYRTIRHPSYLGLIVYSVGWALVFRSVAGLMLAALTALVLIGRMKAEEKLLLDHFGAEYERYRQRTWRLVPGIY